MIAGYIYIVNEYNFGDKSFNIKKIFKSMESAKKYIERHQDQLNSLSIETRILYD